jgi:hypothetical protein
VIASALKSGLAPFLSKRLSNTNVTVSTFEIEKLIGEWLIGSHKEDFMVDTVHDTKIDTFISGDQETTVMSEKVLLSKTVNDLKTMCKSYHLQVNGTKATLVSRILTYLDTDTTDQAVVSNTAQPKKTSKKCSVAHVLSDDDDSPVACKKPSIKKTAAKKRLPSPVKAVKTVEVSELNVQEDEYGNKVHVETGFVFNVDDEVIGFKDKTGILRDLTKEKIETCKEMGLSYTVPYNLSSDEESLLDEK